jgi:hypothetical protein
MVGFQAAYARRGVKLELGARLPVPHRVEPRAADARCCAAIRREHEMFGELRLVLALTDEQIAAMRDTRLVGTVKLRVSNIFDSGVCLRVELMEGCWTVKVKGAPDRGDGGSIEYLR